MSAGAVLRVAGLEPGVLGRLIARYRVEPVALPPGAGIPGSYWGAPEAGLVGHRICFRADTPVHSLLHELAHFVCMDPARRANLDTDAGGDDREECAVCYLEVLLAPELPPFDADRCLADMDAWGYSFREGAAKAWFDGDGREARDWLLGEALVDERNRPTWRLRGEMPAPHACALPDSRGVPDQSFVGFGASP